jgi:hypothetical protein
VKDRFLNCDFRDVEQPGCAPHRFLPLHGPATTATDFVRPSMLCGATMQGARRLKAVASLSA